jgi:hypothetical protein
MTDEMSVLTVSEHRERLGERLVFRLPPHEVVTTLHD